MNFSEIKLHRLILFIDFAVEVFFYVYKKTENNIFAYRIEFNRVSGAIVDNRSTKISKDEWDSGEYEQYAVDTTKNLLFDFLFIGTNGREPGWRYKT